MPWSNKVFLHTVDPGIRHIVADAIEAAGGVVLASQTAPPQSTGLLVLDVSITPGDLANLASSARTNCTVEHIAPSDKLHRQPRQVQPGKRGVPSLA